MSDDFQLSLASTESRVSEFLTHLQSCGNIEQSLQVTNTTDDEFKEWHKSFAIPELMARSIRQFTRVQPSRLGNLAREKLADYLEGNVKKTRTIKVYEGEKIIQHTEIQESLAPPQWAIQMILNSEKEAFKTLAKSGLIPYDLAVRAIQALEENNHLVQDIISDFFVPGASGQVQAITPSGITDEMAIAIKTKILDSLGVNLKSADIPLNEITVDSEEIF
jgi:hypothetical protein